jgi:hypothetical protein
VDRYTCPCHADYPIRLDAISCASPQPTGLPTTPFPTGVPSNNPTTNIPTSPPTMMPMCVKITQPLQIAYFFPLDFIVFRNHKSPLLLSFVLAPFPPSCTSTAYHGLSLLTAPTPNTFYACVCTLSHWVHTAIGEGPNLPQHSSVHPTGPLDCISRH